ncbi:MAG: hypothetical protein DHS20C11_38390 [Lysobacteraceae bacterium]|nr:MAG: hypothetical protein DHS20C11_38390 [Xanthomonadaceae bacterium]
MKYFAAIAALSLVCSACSAPSGKPSPRLVASPGVQKLFGDPSVGEVLATGDVKCRVTYRVGSHLPVRTCMTTTEWDEAQRQAQEEASKMISGPCVARQSARGGFMNEGFQGALLPSTCGEGINRSGGG